MTCGTPLAVSAPGPARWPWLAGVPGVTVVEESAGALAGRLGVAGVERLRAWRPVPPPVREAASGALGAVIEAPVLATGRLELRWYLREQTVSRERHRHGNVMERTATE